jgi:hypothetical protein
MKVMYLALTDFDNIQCLLNRIELESGNYISCQYPFSITDYAYACGLIEGATWFELHPLHIEFNGKAVVANSNAILIPCESINIYIYRVSWGMGKKGVSGVE